MTPYVRSTRYTRASHYRTLGSTRTDHQITENHHQLYFTRSADRCNYNKIWYSHEYNTSYHHTSAVHTLHISKTQKISSHFPLFSAGRQQPQCHRFNTLACSPLEKFSQRVHTPSYTPSVTHQTRLRDSLALRSLGVSAYGWRRSTKSVSSPESPESVVSPHQALFAAQTTHLPHNNTLPFDRRSALPGAPDRRAGEQKVVVCGEYPDLAVGCLFPLWSSAAVVRAQEYRGC